MSPNVLPFRLLNISVDGTACFSVGLAVESFAESPGFAPKANENVGTAVLLSVAVVAAAVVSLDAGTVGTLNEGVSAGLSVFANPNPVVAVVAGVFSADNVRGL